jgi:hypothetical protein
MRLSALLPRAVVVVLVWVLATAAFTYAADRKNLIGPSPASSPVPAKAPELTVPSVSGQAFVFAKGILEDSGFAWRVTGSVHGYPSNQVMAQSPAAGTRVVDTGAPTVVLTLVRGKYGENGTPEDTPSYTGTRIKLANLPTRAVPRVAAKPKPKPVRKPVKKPASKPAAHKPAAHKPAAHKPAKKHSAPAPAKRPPDFTSPRAPKEPLDEITLPARADRLAAWIAGKPKRTNANVQRWLYQHAWIVTGANFGWWHGSQALVKLIAVDHQVEQLWGIGSKSEAVARSALARVRRHAR